MRKVVIGIVAALFAVAGIGLLCYPWFSNWYANQSARQDIAQYQNAVADLNTEKIENEFKRAEAYNQSLSGVHVTDPFLQGSGTAQPSGYDEILNVNGTGVMASIQIPKIDVTLPVYHGVAESALSRGVGHMSMTAFPIGGAGAHTVLAGHRGLPKQELFTRLDVLEKGDRFYIKVLNRTLAYEVDDITTVEPENTDLLRPQAGEDFVTLATCTPLGINSHRLLVRGRRVPYAPNEELHAAQHAKLSVSQIQLIIGATLAVLIMTSLLITAAHKRRTVPPVL
jgi:sortase A